MQLSPRQLAALSGATLEASIIDQVASLEVMIRGLKQPDMGPVLDRLTAIQDRLAGLAQVMESRDDSALLDAIRKIIKGAIPAPAKAEKPIDTAPIMDRLASIHKAVVAKSDAPGKYTFDIERNEEGRMTRVVARQNKSATAISG